MNFEKYNYFIYRIAFLECLQELNYYNKEYNYTEEEYLDFILDSFYNAEIQRIKNYDIKEV